MLIDWTYPGVGPVLPTSWRGTSPSTAPGCPSRKEDAIDALRAALARHGVDTDGWWDRQLALCLLGALVMFGWEKALGDDDELGWWCDRAREGAPRL